MTDSAVFIQFARGVSDLLESGLPLRSALESLHSAAGRTRLGAFSESVLSLVLQGYALSASIGLNAAVPVSPEKVTLIAAAERTGDVIPVLRFLVEQEERRLETRRRLLEVMLYPALVLVAAAFGTGMLLAAYREFAFAAVPEGALAGCVRAGAFLIVFLLLFGVIYARLFSSEPAFFFFYMLSFLLSSGINVAECLRIVSGSSSRKASLLAEEMLVLIGQGIPFADAFRQRYGGRDVSELTLFLELASSHGKLSSACSMISGRIRKRWDGRQQLALRMAEPVLLTGTGICLLILLEGAVLPFLTQFGGVI